MGNASSEPSNTSGAAQDPESEDDSSHPIHKAAAERDAEKVREFLQTEEFQEEKLPAAPDSFGYTALHTACMCGHPEIAEMLLEAGYRPDRGNDIEAMTPLHEAVRHGEAEVVKTLLQADAGIDTDTGLDKGDNAGRTPLYRACEIEHVGIARILLDAGADPSCPNKNGDTPLHQAVLYGNVELAKLLVDRGASVTDGPSASSEHPPLFAEAVESGALEMVQFILGRYEDREPGTGALSEALGTAAQMGATEVAEMLIERGAEVGQMGLPGALPS